jgi:hypothetical protein
MLPPSWLAPILLCWVSFGLRLQPLWANRFHSDEALYASWALAIAFGRDRLLALAAPDKPPLLFYLMAVAFFILGHAEVAARLIGVMASVLSVALMWQLAQFCHSEQSEQAFPCGTEIRRSAQGDIFRGLANGSGIGALAMVLSPMAIAFSPTAVRVGIAGRRDAQAAWLGRRVPGTGGSDQAPGTDLCAVGGSLHDCDESLQPPSHPAP